MAPLENPMDGGAWWAAVHGVAKSRTRLSDFTFTFHLHALEKEMLAGAEVSIRGLTDKLTFLLGSEMGKRQFSTLSKMNVPT